MPSQLIPLIFGEDDADVMLDFHAHYAVVDNYSDQWVHLVGPDRFAPPMRQAFQIRFDAGIRHVRARFASPPGLQADGLAGQIANVVVYS